ncbi:hypothetical protein CHH49_18055 [Terribacillus saccharophilus]|uniref:helix-turn-helix domain-containing protein n=1 Tax=Terribacillus saccharophilus TaxID=361277 RepID=UPI000BA787B4|nr:helix-turn-helix domain-containing protein [Terribacillus saccharophilus]PAF20073.1 hypothetical protein CHH49_18055 [Terribacillus saccharophilus]
MAKFSEEELLKILDEEFLSTREAADTLGISERAVASLVSRKKLRQINKSGAKLYLKSDILKRKEQQGDLREKFRPYDKDK